MAEKRKADAALSPSVRIERADEGPAVLVLPDGTRVLSESEYRVIVPRAVCTTLADPVAAFDPDEVIWKFCLDPAHPWLVAQWGRDFKEFCGEQAVCYEPSDKSFNFEFDGHWVGFVVGDDIAKYMAHFRKPQRYITFALLVKKNQSFAKPKYDHWRVFTGSTGYGARYWSQNATWIVPEDEVVEAINYLCTGPFLMVSIVRIDTAKPPDRKISFQNPASQLAHSALNDFTHGEEAELALTYGRGGLFEKIE